MSIMKNKNLLAVGLVCMTSVAFAAPKGTAARATALKYPAHAEQDGVSTGAKLLTGQQTRQEFVTDLNRCCVIVEFALYPQKDKPIDLSLNDFTLRTVGTDHATKAASAKLISSTLQRRVSSSRDVTVSPVAGIGYESQPVYDPQTGRERRQGGVYTQAGVGVGVDPSGNLDSPTDSDRKVMEVELDEKGIPEGMAATPVAGYVYFNLPKKAKNAHYELDYMLNGNKMTLRLDD